MPGVNLNLDLPTLADTFATIVSKLVTALAAVQTDLTPKITPSQISVNAPLSLAGNGLTQITSILFAGGNPLSSIVPGAMYYSAGEFFVVDAAGVAIQLTANGALNIGAIGGFVGDYVASNPTGAAYDLASGQFRFTKAVSVWADLVAANMLLQGSAGSVKLGVDSSINSARLLTFKALPASGSGLMAYKSSTSTLEDASGVTDPVTIGGNVTMPSFGHTTAWQHFVNFLDGTGGGLGGVTILSERSMRFANNPADTYDTPPLPMREGELLTTLEVYALTGGGAGATLTAQVGALGEDNTITMFGSPVSQSPTVLGRYTFAISSQAMNARQRLFVRFVSHFGTTLLTLSNIRYGVIANP